MKVSKELKVGIMSLAAIVAFYFGFNFLKGSDFFSTTRIYYTYYDHAKGLNVSNPVKINGVTIGRINSMELDTKKSNKVKVGLEVNQKFDITDDSKAILTSEGPLGVMFVDLKIGKNTKIIESGSVIDSFVESGILDKLTDTAPNMISKVDSLMTNMNNLLKEFNGLGNKVKGTVDTYNHLGLSVNGTLAENRRNLLAMSSNLAQLTSSLVQTEKSFKPIINKMDTFAGSLNTLELKETIDKTNASLGQLQAIMKKVENGEGSLGALLNDDLLYNNINQVTTDLDKLLIDMRKNPKRYIKVSVF